MELVLFSLAVFVAGGCLSLAFGSSRAANLTGALSAVAAALAGLVPAAQVLMSGTRLALGPAHVLPLGPTALALDPLSAAFIVPVLILCGVCALYGLRYLEPLAGKRNLGAHWFFYNLLAAGMLAVFTAADAFSFMLAWEAMSLAPFFLLCLHDEDDAVRRAALTYLVAAHLGALALLACFGLISMQSGSSLVFADFLPLAGPAATAVFLLALAGFGTKAGLMPLHVWLPEAHPAAPSHVSALMSGAMIKTGIYGLLRMLSFCGSGETWWALLLIGLGAVTGFAGICFAMAQNDIKRSLAYSSVENMGIACLGVGMALFCRQLGFPGLAMLCLTGAILHMVNHALIKSMLFLGAGAVLHAAGTRDLNSLGGLLRRMPVVAACFALGSAAIAALPPFNGFAGEFLLYLAMASGGSVPSGGITLVFWLGVFVLAGIGGFTLLCFARLFAMAFLGEPRSAAGVHAHDPDPLQKSCLVFLAVLCLASSAAAPRLAAALAPASAIPLARQHSEAAIVQAPAPLASVAPALILPDPDGAIPLLADVNQGFSLALAAFAGLFLVRRRLLRGRSPASGPTWDCGYAAPTSRMQYTGAAFSQPATAVMRSLLHQEEHSPGIVRYFPEATHASITVADRVRDSLFVPLFAALTAFARRCKKLQHGHLNIYVLYILLTLVALLAWELR